MDYCLPLISLYCWLDAVPLPHFFFLVWKGQNGLGFQVYLLCMSLLETARFSYLKLVFENDAVNWHCPFNFAPRIVEVQMYVLVVKPGSKELYGCASVLVHDFSAAAILKTTNLDSLLTLLGYPRRRPNDLQELFNYLSNNNDELILSGIRGDLDGDRDFYRSLPCTYFALKMAKFIKHPYFICQATQLPKNYENQLYWEPPTNRENSLLKQFECLSLQALDVQTLRQVQGVSERYTERL